MTLLGISGVNSHAASKSSKPTAKVCAALKALDGLVSNDEYTSLFDPVSTAGSAPVAPGFKERMIAAVSTNVASYKTLSAAVPVANRKSVAKLSAIYVKLRAQLVAANTDAEADANARKVILEIFTFPLAEGQKLDAIFSKWATQCGIPG